MDARECASILGITLTWRNNVHPHNHETYDGAMAGFPHHALDTYLPKLIRAGKKVAICDRLEDPRLTNKIVKGDITELVSPKNARAMNQKEMLQAVIADYENHRNMAYEIHIKYSNGTKAGIGNKAVIQKVIDTLIAEAKRQLSELS